MQIINKCILLNKKYKEGMKPQYTVLSRYHRKHTSGKKLAYLCKIEKRVRVTKAGGMSAREKRRKLQITKLTVEGRIR